MSSDWSKSIVMGGKQAVGGGWQVNGEWRARGKWGNHGQMHILNLNEKVKGKKKKKKSYIANPHPLLIKSHYKNTKYKKKNPPTIGQSTV